MKEDFVWLGAGEELGGGGLFEGLVVKEEARRELVEGLWLGIGHLAKWVE